jgi:hypothetical protein
MPWSSGQIVFVRPRRPRSRRPFTSAAFAGSRYATLGVSDEAGLDDGATWPTADALKELTDAEEATIAALVQKAVG